MGVARSVGPAFDAGEKALDAGAVALDGETVAGKRITVAIFLQRGDQVLYAGEKENVRVRAVLITGQLPLGLAGDVRERQGPTQAEGAVAGTGIVGQGKGRREAAAAGRKGKRDGKRRGTGRRVDGKFIVDAAERAPALGKGEGRTRRPALLGPGSRRLVRRGWLWSAARHARPDVDFLRALIRAPTWRP